MGKISARKIRFETNSIPPTGDGILSLTYEEAKLERYAKYPELNEEFYSRVISYLDEKKWPKYLSREWVVRDMCDMYYSHYKAKLNAYNMKPTKGVFWKQLRIQLGRILVANGYDYPTSDRGRKRSVCFIKIKCGDVSNVSDT